MSPQRDRHQAARPINMTAALEVLLLAAFATMLLSKAAAGLLALYTHPRTHTLIVGAAVLLMIVAAVRATTIIGHVREPFRLHHAVLALVVVVATLLPARPLGADALSSTSTTIAAAAVVPSLDDDTSRWNLFQWGVAASTQGEALVGRQADVVGFVYHDPERPFNGFWLMRFVMMCCTADSNGVGLPVLWPAGTELTPDTWVHVRGQIQMTTVAGRPEPALIPASVEIVPRPKDPYVYP